MVAHALGAAADLAVAFGREQIHGLADFGAARPRLHVKGLDRARITIDEHRLVVTVGDGRLVRRAEVHAPFEFEQFLLFGVGLFFV